jgi:dolichyl-phosphate beta-glucosyltransferase
MLELSIIIPAHNEQNCLEGTVKEYAQWCRVQKFSWEIILVDSCSQDKTSDIIKQFNEEMEEIKCTSIKIGGKGSAIKKGLSKAKGKYILFTDADCSVLPDDINILMVHLKKDSDIAIGNRHISESNVDRSFARNSISKSINFLTSIYLKTNITDHFCGFKLFTAEVARKIFYMQRIKGFSFDPEILFIAKKLGYKITEAPITWKEKPDSKLHFFSIFKIIFDILRIKKLHKAL